MAFHARLDRFYLGSDTRAFGILLGALLAVTATPRLRRIATWLSPLAVGVLVVAVIWLDGSSLASFRGQFQVTSLAGAALICAVTGFGNSLLRTVLSNAILVSVGKWSYGIYLFHWPLLLVLNERYELAGWGLATVVVFASTAFAFASFRWVESPLRNQGLRAFRGPPLTLATAAVIVVVAVAATVVGARAPLTASAVVGQSVPTIPASPETPATVDTNATVGITPRPVDRPYRIMVVGDSVGASLVPQLDALSSQVGIEVFSRAAPSCSYDRVITVGSAHFREDPLCVDIVEGWVADVASFRPDVVLFSYGSWSGWTYEGQFRTQCDPILAAYVSHLYSLAVSDLGSFGAPVYMIQPAYWR
ncbi:MAG TPA: hypothetical protein PLV68_11920, partial [Ilumatobacteraceae bacterium]|nr:hypothetical protein [Ilumatobacteraceae bacterium]